MVEGYQVSHPHHLTVAAAGPTDPRQFISDGWRRPVDNAVVALLARTADTAGRVS